MDEAETKAPPNSPATPKEKNFALLRKSIRAEFARTRDATSATRDRDTSNILNLVRNLSNQEVDLPSLPDVSFGLKKLIRFSEERRATHAASQQHFIQMNAIFFWPSIALTSMTSATSFLASYFPDHTTKFNVAMGIMASLSTLIVALSETYKYGSKAEQHGLASESYENLRTRLFFKSIQLQMDELKAAPGEEVPPMTPCEFKAFFTSVEDQITEIARQCKYLVPNSIIKKYKENRYDSMIESLNRNMKTVIAQDEFSQVVDKLSKGEPLNQKDQKIISKLEKKAKQSRQKKVEYV